MKNNSLLTYFIIPSLSCTALIVGAKMLGQQGAYLALILVLERLSDKLRAVIVLHYYGRLSYAEIAESLNIPIGTVKSRLDLGLRTLRRELDPSKLDWFLGKEEEVIT